VGLQAQGLGGRAKRGKGAFLLDEGDGGEGVSQVSGSQGQALAGPKFAEIRANRDRHEAGWRRAVCFVAVSTRGFVELY